MFHDPPFSLMHDWYNVQTQLGQCVIDPATICDVEKPVMRELGDKLGLSIPDCILLFSVDQYQHLNMKSNVRLYGDPTRLIREFVVHHKGFIPPTGDERRFDRKRVPIPAKLITKYMNDRQPSIG